MSCNGCTETTSKCNDDCTGCLYQSPTNCVVLEDKLSCFSKPAGTELSVILEDICSALQSIPAKNVTVNFTDLTGCFDSSEIEDFNLQDVIEGYCATLVQIQQDISNLNASDITVTALDCINSSDVSGGDLQSTLEDLCDVISGVQLDIEDLQDEADWFVNGTSNQATDITDEIYTLGKVGIGVNAPTEVLHVIGDFLAVYNTVKLIGDTVNVSSLSGLTPSIVGEALLLQADKDGGTNYKAFVGTGAYHILGDIASYLRIESDTGRLGSIQVYESGSDVDTALFSGDGVVSTNFVISKNGLSIDSNLGYNSSIDGVGEQPYTQFQIVKGIIVSAS